jgi:hypothetical protein
LAHCFRLFNRIRTGRVEEFEPTGWTRVDRTVGEIRDRLAAATQEEHFQTVGLLCREVLISLAQAVFVADCYPSLDGIAPSKTDAKRMLECYIAVELAGGVNEEARRHSRSGLEATTAVVNIVAIVSGRRDPQ